jgi:hypothetical protein
MSYGSEELETEGAREEAMERNNWASQNSQGVVELKKNKKEESKHNVFWLLLSFKYPKLNMLHTGIFL